MNLQNQPSNKNSLNYKLKPISLIVFSLFAQQANAQSAQQQDEQKYDALPQAITGSLDNLNPIESKFITQPKNKKQAKTVLADASTAVKSIPKPNTSADSSIDVYDVLLGDDPRTNSTNNNIPSIAERYGVTKELLKTAAVTDANPQGVSEAAKANARTLSKDKGTNNLPIDIELNKVQVRAKRFHEIGPLPGLGLTKEEIPGNVQSITAKEIKESHSLSLTDLMNKKLQSVNVNDYQGNPFQMDVTYRGFTAGPQIGTPQGLSVFLDGIRVNEPFGDVVNWDMIPMNAIAGVDVFPGSNPIFGLNTLGGAFTLKTKDGFNNEGIDAEVLAGSFGRKQLQVEGGINNGEFALFGAGNFFLEDGWRDNSPSKVNQFFGKASYRGDKLDLSLSTLLVQTDLVGNGLFPSEMYAQNRNGVFSSPDTTKNRLQQFQLSSSYFVNDNFTVTGQAYRRNSKRHQVGADVFTDYGENRAARRLPIAGEEQTCVFLTTNAIGIPDYVVIPINITAGEDITTSSFYNDYWNNGGIVDLAGQYASNVNALLPDSYAAEMRELFDRNRNVAVTAVYDQNTPPDVGSTGPVIDINNGVGIIQENSYDAGTNLFRTSIGGNRAFVPVFPGENIALLDTTYFYTKQGSDDIKNYVFVKPPINADICQQDPGTSSEQPGPYMILMPDGSNKLIDGFMLGQPGHVEGTPTAIFNDNQIDQVVDGASVQFNWNFEQHKFMLGASIDAASADYSNSSRLGFLDANRSAYLDPAQAHPQFLAAFIPLVNNNFSGTNTTKSIYFSETWTPVEAWHFNASGRYNTTKTKNKVAARYGNGALGPGDFISYPNEFDTCTDLNGDCLTTPRNYRPLQLNDTLDPAETEKFSYYSFNPSIGATWQAKENLNLFANWAKGTRTPSVIELGCAFDKTPVFLGGDPNNPLNYQPKSLVENRSCTLPTTLSGDPFLPQIKATTYDVGLRGSFNGLLGADNLEWNLGAYQTDLKDDIYFVSVGQGAGFFDTVGKTRRRGLEAGLSGKKEKWGFGINYGLTDATFEDNFFLINEDNSSSFFKNGFGNVIEVKKGNRMPGVPLHNLNANVSYEITPKWQVGLSAVVHSESFVRGNENNAHKKGVIQRNVDIFNPVTGVFERFQTPPTNNPGKVPGYATFNFQTSYKFNAEWTASMMVNNLFDKEYFTAGRLGRNPFSPSIAGAIGPSGYNHNSGDWLSTNFIAPSAPRGVWFSLNWQFAPDKK